MNIVYPIMLKNFIQNLNSTKCSIVIDDYGIDEKFKTLLSELKNQQYQIKVENGADERHLEVKLASVLAKYERMRLLSVYDKKYSLEGNGIGSGHIEDEVTKKWIRLWKKTKRPWPDFVKKWLIQ
jgi:ribonuclease HII